MQKILIVEDDIDIQDILKNHLIDVGYEVAVAPDGVAGIAMFDDTIDLVLLDIMLPKIDGYGVCEVIRKRSQVPIIMLTALSDEENQLRGFEQQIDDYLPKPFSPKILLCKIAAILRRRTAENQNICNVKLENFDLSHVPVYIMDEEMLSLYAVYMATLGNREDLFPGSGYVDKYTKPPTTYDIPPSALEDETFAALITEAEKYIGYPYVWGGSNPNTSFDCSGFVSWALTQSGVCNTGRLGAQGLYNISTPVSSANARPGDLIFFVGTYDTPGVSHVGIYVGGGKMLHCGDPIQYADINTSYWQSHFYAFGRPPYN